ncbi:hypothetical protein FWP31_05195 [Vibrio cholerae]|nr:hypothetical protein [Vibrio cholerae]
MFHTEKPKSGKGRKAWERFEEKHGKPPFSVEYVPNYDNEFKGWICEIYPQGQNPYASAYGGDRFGHVFYLSCEL